MDNGSKFKAKFSELYKNMGLKRKESDSWNPQLHSILERIHQVLGDGLRAFDLDNININPEDDDPFNKYITGKAYAICCTYHQTHVNSPGQLVYGRDMFLPLESKIDWNTITSRNKTGFERTMKEKTPNALSTISKKKIGRHSHDRDPLIELWLTVVWDHTKW